MQSSGPDSPTSWVIAVVCCFINMMMFGMQRLSGILFVASVARFQTSRQKASFPYSFCSCVRNSLSPLLGYLGHKFGVRTVTTLGCIVGAIGAGMCYFAENIYTVTILWGAVFGVGFGMGNVLLPVSINQYFDKYRATASGISFSGACFGSFILPPIVEILLNTYGLSGTYLFLSGFILNCVPAALLLTKPRFEIKNSKCSNVANNDRQSVTSGMKVKMYTAENGSQKSLSISKVKESVNFAPKSERKSISCQDPKEGEMKSNLTYEERIKRLSTQTLLSEYSIHMSTSEPLDVDEIIENSKGRRQVDPAVLEAEALSLSSHNTDQDVSSEKDEVFEKESRSSSVQHEKSIPEETSDVSHTLSSESLVSENAKSFSKSLKEGYTNYGYQVEIQDMKSDFSPNVTHQKNTQRRRDIQSSDNEVYLNYTYQNNKATDQYKKPPSYPNTFPKSSEWSDMDNFKVRHGVLSPASDKEIVVAKTEKSSCLGSFSIIFDPTFLMITISHAIYSLNFLTVMTIIVDFARDLNIETSNEKYTIMALSVGDIVGRLGLGWITDYGYMSTSSFAALCFACQGITTSAFVLSDGFISFIVVCTLYGLSEAGNIVVLPVLIAQYIDEDKQTVAISSSNFLSGPLCLAVAPLIGYFRDDIGSYHYIFYEIAILSAICCVGSLLLPCVARCRRQI